MADSTEHDKYAARLEVDHPDTLNRLTTFFRLIWIIPIAIIVGLITGSGETVYMDEAGQVVGRVGGLASGLVLATALMIVFRRRYPRWWFDFSRELARFQGRVGAYLLLVTDQYPSTIDEQSVHLEIDYPDVERDLNQWLPLVKWLLAIPHYVVLFFLFVAVFFAVIFAWLAILVTGTYPRAIFDFVVGVGRWGLRVAAYAFLLVTDRYPPFSLR
jgi:hypothetical protein